VSTSIIHWYPGHIAKAEKQLTKNLAKVDLVIEVRDARIPISTSHPHLQKWIKGKKHLLVINRKDMIPKRNIEEWQKWYKGTNQNPLWCNAKSGDGVSTIKKTAISLGYELNARRKLRGMKTRAVRALLLGFPNVGKSALINRLIQKKVVSSSRRAGVTRSLQWIRLDEKIDLLDAPGVLPSNLENQQAALKLAICDDIGQGGYNTELVAISFLNMLQDLEKTTSIAIEKSISLRYGISFKEADWDPYKWLFNAAKLHTSENLERMSQKLLDDFRKTLLGQIPLELPV